ncbi:MAG: ABC transporter ATP-binding protein, partial [Balneolaceae bacterium]
MFQSLKKIYGLFTRKDRFKFFVIFCLMLVASILQLLGIGLIPFFVQSVMNPDFFFNMRYVGDFLQMAGIETRESLVIYGAILLIIVYLLKNFYLVYFSYLNARFLANQRIYLQNRLFKAYMTAPYSYYLNRNSAQMLRNVTGEVGKIINGTIKPFLDITLNVIMFSMIIGALLYYDPVITLVAICVLGGGGYLFLRITQEGMIQSGKDDRDARGDLNKVVLQGLGGFKDARVLNREKMFLKEYNYNAQITKRTSVYRSIINSLPKPIIETLLVTGLLMVTLITVLEGMASESIIFTLVLFGTAAIKLMPIFNSVISQINSLQFNVYSVNAVHDDLQYLESEYERYRQRILQDTKKLELTSKIELKSVSYNYPNADEQAVREVSLTVPKGDAVAFVGPSGAGKTTLVDVILGLLRPQSGTIEVDGKDVYENIRGWMKNI